MAKLPSLDAASFVYAEAWHSPKLDALAADDVTLKLSCKGGAAVWGCTWPSTASSRSVKLVCGGKAVL